MSWYSDGINQAIQNHQNEIGQHFKRFGVHHPGHRWNHRDLYNGYRVYGSPFLEGLTGLVATLFGQGGTLGQNSPVWNRNRRQHALSVSGTDGIDESPELQLALPLGGSSYMGPGDDYSRSSGRDHRQDDRDRHRYFNEYLRWQQPWPMYYSTPWIGLNNGQQYDNQMPEPLPVDDDMIFGFRKKTLMLVAIVAGLALLYFKFRR